MAYPSGVAYRHIGSVAGLQQIGDTSTTQLHRLGTIVKAFDHTYGEGEFIYLLGVASTAAGDAVVYNSKTGATTRLTATSVGTVGVAMSANVASQYGWYQIGGAGPVKSGTVASGASVYPSATAAQVDDAVTAGYNIDGMVTTATDSGGYVTVQMSRPSITAESVVPSFYYATLSAAAEAADAIVVTGAVKTLDGVAVTAAKQVVVRTLAVTANKGDITVTAGTEKKTVNPATGENVSWIETTAAGAFAVSVANDVAEATLISVEVEGGFTAALTLTFA